MLQSTGQLWRTYLANRDASINETYFQDTGAPLDQTRVLQTTQHGCSNRPSKVFQSTQHTIEARVCGAPPFQFTEACVGAHVWSTGVFESAVQGRVKCSRASIEARAWAWGKGWLDTLKLAIEARAGVGCFNQLYIALKRVRCEHACCNGLGMALQHVAGKQALKHAFGKSRILHRRSTASEHLGNRSVPTNDALKHVCGERGRFDHFSVPTNHVTGEHGCLNRPGVALKHVSGERGLGNRRKIEARAWRTRVPRQTTSH